MNAHITYFLLHIGMFAKTNKVIQLTVLIIIVQSQRKTGPSSLIWVYIRANIDPVRRPHTQFFSQDEETWWRRARKGR
jgi:hypothetical protein